MKMMLVALCGLIAASCVPSNAVRSRPQMDHINNSVVALVSAFDLETLEEGVDIDEDSTLDSDHPQWIYCSGTFVSRDLVLTAAHCVNHEDNSSPIGDRVKIGTYQDYLDTDTTFENRAWTYFEVVAFDRGHDIALLKRKERITSRYTSLRIGDAPAQGERVLVSGHPRGLGWSLTDGIVSAPYRAGSSALDQLIPDGNRGVYVQISAPVFYGNSGGPLINSENELIGVVSNGGPWHIVMAVHPSVIKTFLYEYSISRRSR